MTMSSEVNVRVQVRGLRPLIAGRAVLSGPGVPRRDTCCDKTSTGMI